MSRSLRSAALEFLDLFFRALRLFSELFEFLFELVQFVIGKFFQVDQFVSGGTQGPNQFIELEMDGLRVAILGVLDQENHQEGDDGRPGIDDELPRVRVMKCRTRHRPDDDDENGADESPGAAENRGRFSRKDPECISNATEEISLVAFILPSVGRLLCHAP